MANIKPQLKPDVSVIIPFYNAEKHLARSVESVLWQTHENLELILINDGSTDGSLAKAERFASTDKRVRLINKHNEGVSTARNAGLEIASGDYLAFLDSDDCIKANAIEKLLHYAHKNSADAILFEYTIVLANGEKLHKAYPEYAGSISRQDAIKYVITPISRFVWNKFFSRELLDDIRFPPNIHFGEDTLFSIQMLHKAKNIHYFSYPFYLYYQHEASVTHAPFNSRVLTGVTAYKLQTEFCQHYYPELEALAHLYYKNLIMNVILLITNEVGASYQQTKKELYRIYRSDLIRHLLKANAPFRLKVKLFIGWLSHRLLK